jgi:hypothetical protein
MIDPVNQSMSCQRRSLIASVESESAINNATTPSVMASVVRAISTN